jgi:hypothetical protein
MSNGTLHVDRAGEIGKPKTQSPKAIHAWGQAREGFARVVAGGVILGALAVAYIFAVFLQAPEADKILLVLSSGVGFLLGRGSKSSSSDE